MEGPLPSALYLAAVCIAVVRRWDSRMRGGVHSTAVLTGYCKTTDMSFTLDDSRGDIKMPRVLFSQASL